MDLHANYSSYIIELMKENVRTGAPVNPPIWWISPNDSTASSCRAVLSDLTTDGDPNQSVCRFGRSNVFHKLARASNKTEVL